jgi:hypothetical protein
VVALAGTKLDLRRQRIQQHTRGHHGRSDDPLYPVRRTLRTRYPTAGSKRCGVTPSDRSASANSRLRWAFYNWRRAYGGMDLAGSATVVLTRRRRRLPNPLTTALRPVGVQGRWAFPIHLPPRAVGAVAS